MKKIQNAWAFYDWANSVYSLIISSSIFPLFYGALFGLAGLTSYPLFGIDTPSSAVISYITAIGFVFISIMSPILSGVADYLGNKKFFLRLFCTIGSVSCAMLYFFSLEYFYFSIAFYMLALIGFWGSLLFYSSYLPDISKKEEQDTLSAKGYAYGYIGSFILLVLSLVFIFSYEKIGLKSQIEAMRYSFVMVGIWWFGFGHWAIGKLPNFRNSNQLQPNTLFLGIKELKKVWYKLKEQQYIKKYLFTYFIYSVGVQTLMIIAAYFGEQEIEWGSGEDKTFGLIISVMLIQLIAILGAYSTSKISTNIGNIKTLIILNSFWALICIYAYFLKTPNDFYIAAALVGLVMGGIQSLSRSTYSKILPQTSDTTSYFSFFEITEKIAIVIGMTLYGVVTHITGKVQNAVLLLGLFFILAVYLLYKLSKYHNKTSSFVE